MARSGWARIHEAKAPRARFLITSSAKTGLPSPSPPGTARPSLTAATTSGGPGPSGASRTISSRSTVLAGSGGPGGPRSTVDYRGERSRVKTGANLFGLGEPGLRRRLFARGKFLRLGRANYFLRPQKIVEPRKLFPQAEKNRVGMKTIASGPGQIDLPPKLFRQASESSGATRTSLTPGRTDGTDRRRGRRSIRRG